MRLFFIVFLLSNEACDVILAEVKRNFKREGMFELTALGFGLLLLAFLLLPLALHSRNF